MKVEGWQLTQRQGLPLEAKVMWSQGAIREWHEQWEGKVYISFSGGKDSTVLLDLTRGMYPDVKAVFFDTGLEFPEIRAFVKTFQNVEWIRPKRSFKDIVETYGYPIISKEQSQYIRQVRDGQPEQVRRFIANDKHFSVGNKYRYLVDAPFKISERCCYHMKKGPAKSFERKSGLHPIVGTMATDSRLRLQTYLAHGCNAFDSARPMSLPMGFWKEEDVWAYIHTKNLPYCSIYDIGYKNTGCVFCAFGAHLQKEPNKFQLLYDTHPKLWRYCMDELGMREVLEYIKVPTEPRERLL